MPSLHAPQLQELQRQALEGKNTDLVVRLKLPRNEEDGADDGGGRAKRARRREEKEGEAERVVAEIPCKSAVLSARSAYIKACLQGEWREAGTRTVDITLEDEQAVADFQLMLKLSYSASYTKDGLVPLDRETRLRLAQLADAYEMTDCVTECLLSLADNVSLEDAIACLDQVPGRLAAHPATAALKEKLIPIVAQGIEFQATAFFGTPAETEASRDLIARAGSTLAGWIGPVSDLFQEGPRVQLGPLRGGFVTAGCFTGPCP